MKTLFNVLLLLTLINLEQVISMSLGMSIDYSPQNRSSEGLDMRRSVDVFNGLQEDKDRRIVYFNKILDTLRILMHNTSATLESCNNISLASQSNDTQCKEYSCKTFNNGTTGFSLTSRDSQPINNNMTEGSDQPKLGYERESITISKTNERHFDAANILSTHSNYTNKLTVTLTNQTVSNVISSELYHSETSQNITSDLRKPAVEINKSSPTTLINSNNISGSHFKGSTNVPNGNFSDSRLMQKLPLKDISVSTTLGSSTAFTSHATFPSKSIHADNVTNNEISNVSSLNKVNRSQGPPNEFYLNTSISDNIVLQITTEPFNIYELLPAILTFADDATESTTYDLTSSDSEEISSSRMTTKSNVWSEAFPDYERFPPVTKNIENESEESDESDEYSNIYDSSEESAEKSVQFKISSDVLKRYQISEVRSNTSNFSAHTSDKSRGKYSSNGPYIELTEDTSASKKELSATSSLKTVTVTEMSIVTPSKKSDSGSLPKSDSSHHEVTPTGPNSYLTTLLFSKLTASPDKDKANQKLATTPDSVLTSLKPSSISTGVSKVSGCNCYNNRVSIKCSNFTTTSALTSSEAKLTSTVGTTSIPLTTPHNLGTSNTTILNETVSLKTNNSPKTSEIPLKSISKNSTQPPVQSSATTDDIDDFLEFLYNNVTSSNVFGTTAVSSHMPFNGTVNEFDNIFEFLYSNETLSEVSEDVPNIKVVPLDEIKTELEGSNLRLSTHTETALESPYSIMTYLSELGITESLLEALYSQPTLNTNSDLNSSSEESDDHSTVTSNDSSEELESTYSSASTVTDSNDSDLLSESPYTETATQVTSKPVVVVALPSKAARTKKTKNKSVTSPRTTTKKVLKGKGIKPSLKTNATKRFKVISARKKTTKSKVFHNAEVIPETQSSTGVYSDSNVFTDATDPDEIVAETFVDSINLFHTTDSDVNSISANTVEEIVEMFYRETSAESRNSIEQ